MITNGLKVPKFQKEWGGKTEEACMFYQKTEHFIYFPESVKDR